MTASGMDVRGRTLRDFANHRAGILRSGERRSADKGHTLYVRFPDKLALRPPAIMRRGGWNLWLLRSNSTRSPGVNSALSTALLEEEVRSAQSIGLIGVKDFRRMLLRNARRLRVDQRIAHTVRVAWVGERRFAKIPGGAGAGRMTAEGRRAGAGSQMHVTVDAIHQRAEKLADVTAFRSETAAVSNWRP